MKQLERTPHRVGRHAEHIGMNRPGPDDADDPADHPPVLRVVVGEAAVDGEALPKPCASLMMKISTVNSTIPTPMSITGRP